jgi:hypothetical protein
VTIRPHRHNGFPRAERGRRVRWRAVTIGVYFALAVGAIWLTGRWGWPPQAAIAGVGVPYWAAVMAVWRRRGPRMPGLHGKPDGPRMPGLDGKPDGPRAPGRHGEK